MDFSYLDDWLEEETAAQEIEEAGDGHRNIWALVEVHAGSPLPASLEAMGQATELARQIGVYAFGIVLGQDLDAAARQLFDYGADRVLVADDPGLSEYQAETYVNVLAGLVDEQRPEILLLSATPLGKDLGPRLARRLDTGLISHCVKLELDMVERLLLGTTAVLGGDVYHTFVCPTGRPQMATLQPSYFPQPYPDQQRSGTVENVNVDVEPGTGRLTWDSLDARVELETEVLSKARVVVAGGRGMGDAEGFALVKRLAKALGGVVAGSRGAHDEGWVTEEEIVGVGGASIAPDLYVACGLAGDIYHHFGVQDARFIVAINTDETAPIMSLANVAVVGDARQMIPAVLQALDQSSIT